MLRAHQTAGATLLPQHRHFSPFVMFSGDMKCFDDMPHSCSCTARQIFFADDNTAYLQTCTVSPSHKSAAVACLQKQMLCSSHALSQSAAVCCASAALRASACPRKAAQVQACPTDPSRARHSPAAVRAHRPWRTCTADHYDLRGLGSRGRRRRLAPSHPRTAPVADSNPTGPKRARPAAASAPTDPQCMLITVPARKSRREQNF